MSDRMTSMQRLLTVLQHKEPDRTPLFLLFSMYGAKVLGMSIKEYFSNPENVVEAQLKLMKKYHNDCLYTFGYAAIEMEAMGGTVIYKEDGPPLSGAPIIRNPEDIRFLTLPIIKETECLKKVLKVTERLKEEVGDEVPIIGVVMSPFSSPVMQMGFDKYLDLMHENEELFNKLMEFNESFCVQWANAQLEAGATAICYFDPISSTTIIPREKYLKTGYEIAKRTIGKINGPTVTHFASGRCISIIEDVIQTGTLGIAVSALENLNDVKERCRDKILVIGNLNGIEMRHWEKEDTEKNIKAIISEAGQGGGLIISDNHGEIPWQIPEKVLMDISEAVQKWGKYPLEWIDDNGK